MGDPELWAKLTIAVENSLCLLRGFVGAILTEDTPLFGTVPFTDILGDLAVALGSITDSDSRMGLIT